MDIEIFTLILSSLGLGSLLAILIQNYLQSKTRISERLFDFKESRYKAIAILMWTYLSPKSELKHLKFYRSDIPNLSTLKRELLLELYNSMLFASDDVLKVLKAFIQSPSEENYSRVILEMRRDLYSKNTKLNLEDIKI